MLDLVLVAAMFVLWVKGEQIQENVTEAPKTQFPPY